MEDNGGELAEIYQVNTMKLKWSAECFFYCFKDMKWLDIFQLMWLFFKPSSALTTQRMNEYYLQHVCKYVYYNFKDF